MMKRQPDFEKLKPLSVIEQYNLIKVNFSNEACPFQKKWEQEMVMFDDRYTVMKL